MLNRDKKSDNNYIDTLISRDNVIRDYEDYEFLKFFNMGLCPGAMFVKQSDSDDG